MGKQAAGGNKALYNGIYLHWCHVDRDIAIEETNPRFVHTHGGDHGLAGYTAINYQERACFLSLFSYSLLERALSCSLSLADLLSVAWLLALFVCSCCALLSGQQGA